MFVCNVKVNSVRVGPELLDTNLASSVLKQLDAHMPHCSLASWVRHHLVTYADDLVALWSIQSKLEVMHMLTQIGALLDVLHEAGMMVNFDKTVFLLRLSGRQAKAVKKSITCYRNGSAWLRIPRAHHADIYIPGTLAM